MNKPTKYLVKSGRYAGMWHVRAFNKSKYYHIGRFHTETEALKAIEVALSRMTETYEIQKNKHIQINI